MTWGHSLSGNGPPGGVGRRGHEEARVKIPCTVVCFWSVKKRTERKGKNQCLLHFSSPTTCGKCYCIYVCSEVIIKSMEFDIIIIYPLMLDVKLGTRVTKR